MGAAGEEKILVSVRVRPLNEKEKTRNDRCDWECINDTTIMCTHHNLHDKSSYTFDKVFGFECPTKQVYNDGAKEVVLCVLSGINSSIFAYGQTSSGKTYTMSGITEFAMDDIFAYIDNHKQERKFTLRFSAMEIYNEAVRDLLCEDNNTPLRLLDDPERGTVVEKLREETLTDKNHLEELLSICETQRKIGETSLNETSSRSHQILRLTIESSSQESSETFAASVCFVDLAGSERASQTLSAGSRLKEGCHINRSLLTLGTVIRKLSKGKNGHIPYRDSKLTRILQNSLGGNARTAIICTMSPARSHLEQSRNTLHFASCAKEVSTNAQVNLVVSEKALVKQLQRELARMENELKNLGPPSSSTSEFYALLKQKEELIAKMEEQIQELKWQRDVAQSQVENLLKSTTEERSSSSSNDNRRKRSYDSTDFDESRLLNNLGKSNFYSPDDDDFLLDDTTPQIPGTNLQDKWEEMAQSTIQEPEDACKEVRCIEENSREAKRVKIQDSVDNIVEKKVQSLSEGENYKAFMADEKAENEESMKSEKEDADSYFKKIDTELSLYAKIEAGDELSINKLGEEEVQETKQSVEKQRQSLEKEGIEHNLSTDQSCVEDQQNYNASIADKNEATESEKEDVNLSLKTIDMELSLRDKLEAEEEASINKLVEEEEVQESKQSVEKQMQSLEKKGMEQNLSTHQTCLGYKQNDKFSMAEKSEATESEKEHAGLSLETIDMNLSSCDKLEAEEEASINKLVEEEEVQESKQSVEKQMQSLEKEGMEQNLSTHQSCLGYKQNDKFSMAEKSEATESEKEHAGLSLETIDMKLSSCDKSEAEEEVSINKLETQETEEYVEKEETKLSCYPKKENMEHNSSRDQAEQLDNSPSEEGKHVEVYEGFDTYEALKKKVKEMQKTIEYFMSMQSAEQKDSPSFITVSANTSPRDFFKMRKSRSCRENLLFTRAAASAAASGRFIFETSNTSFDSDKTISIDAQSIKDSDTETSNSSLHEFIAGLEEMAIQKNSMHEVDHRDAETKTTKPENTDDRGEKTVFERQQSQIIELWEVCYVPLVHRTIFFLLIKGDPSDFVYMEVELRRLSFLKNSQETTKKQAVKALTREKEWLAKQIPKKFGKKQKEELYKKWGVELSSKQRSLQVTHKLWIKTKDIEQCKESASLVATLVGFVNTSRTPKEMFGLSFSPTSESSGWRLTNSFSRISFTGG